MNIEQMAVHAVQGALLRCSNLDPYLNNSDSIPLTDGHINLHHDNSRTKSTLRGQVPVQIKGKKVPSSRKLPTKFSLFRTDLEGYLKISGVLFFAVFLNEQTRESAPHYAILNPFKLDTILKKAPKGQRKIPVPVKPLPSEPQEIEALVSLARAMQREDPTSVIDPALLDHVKEFTLHTDTSVTLDAPVHLDPGQHDFSLTVTTTGGMRANARGAIHVIPDDYLPQTVNMVVSTSKVAFQQLTRQRLDADTVSLQLNESLRLFLRAPEGQKQAGGMQWHLHSSLRHRLDTLQFVLSALDEGGFVLGESFVTWDASSSLDDEADLRTHLTHLRRLDELFRALGADISLVDLDNVEPKRHRQLSDLYGPLVEEEEVQSDFEAPGRIRQPVGTWGIELICFRGSEPGTVQVRHLFDPDLWGRFAAKDESLGEDSPPFLVTPYEVVDEGLLPYTLNLRLDLLVDCYRAMSRYPNSTERATQTVLKLINAGDQVEDRRGEFLAAAESLNEWLIGQDDLHPALQVNRFQIIRRRRVLTPEERKEVRALKRGVEPAHELRRFIDLSCAVLLGDLEEAEFCFDELDPESQEAVRRWPIWHLWRTQPTAPENS